MLMLENYRARAIGLLAGYAVLLIGLIVTGALGGSVSDAMADQQAAGTESAKWADCSKVRDVGHDDFFC